MALMVNRIVRDGETSEYQVEALRVSSPLLIRSDRVGTSAHPTALAAGSGGVFSHSYMYFLDHGICAGSSPALPHTIWYRLIQSCAKA